MLVRLPDIIDELSVDQFRQKYDEPDTVAVSRADGKSLSENVPSLVALPLYLGKRAQDFTISDAEGLILSDFGEAFAPATERRLGKDCHTP